MVATINPANETTKSAQDARRFLNSARESGWKIDKIQKFDGTVRIKKKIAPGDAGEFRACEKESRKLLNMLPTTSAMPSSVWGSEMGTPAADKAKEKGIVKMHKSGCSRRVLNALLKMA